MDCNITFGKPATYNKRKVIEVKIDSANIPLDTKYTIEKYSDDEQWTFYRTTSWWDPEKKRKKPLLWTSNLRELKIAILSQLPQAIGRAL